MPWGGGGEDPQANKWLYDQTGAEGECRVTGDGEIGGEGSG